MAETSATAAVLSLLAERVSMVDTSSFDSSSSIMPSPSSAATSFELPSKSRQDQAAPSSVQAPKGIQNPAGSAQQSQTASTPPLSFPSLPSDIHHLVLTEYLPYNSIVALRSTSSHFRSLIPPSTLKRLREKVIAGLLADERAILNIWLPQPYGRYSGRPSPYMTCYSCLQSLPTTEFFASQVIGSRGIGRKRAVERWCKPCGLKHGRIRHGKWMEEVNYGYDDQLRYETVMGGQQLKLENPCVTCPPRDRYDSQPVWWGCVDCFKKEEKRLQKQDSERRRDVRRHCSRVKHGVKAFVEPEYLRELGQEVGWWMRANMGWHALVRKGHTVYWWVKDESVVTRASRTCGRVGRVLDPRKIQEPGQKLGRRAKRAIGAIFDIGKKNKEKEGSTTEGETSSAQTEDCVLCCSAGPDSATLEADSDLTKSTVTPPSSHHSHHHHHIPPPHREVRCWRCWRAKRSRRRRRHDDGLAYALPLPKERWCDGCQAEHEHFVALGREKRKAVRGDERRKTVPTLREEKDTAGSMDEPKVNEEVDAELGLGGLFGET
ncbi:hypothetical protein GJ744_012041 [Endocarpon pusillum]|uniref:F-box domain-containing protein n=1 Tax=Endocarpon pusillum TaxID=364733 RepID=A0A8H7E988_9EURO|nr:hypothetical protein GJ744_012041 [Endocarpon pusillum]